MNLKKEQTIYIILLIVGLIILVGSIGLASVIDFEPMVGMSGLGGAWIAISIMKLYDIKKKPEKIEEQLIGQYDERNIAIRGYAGYATFMTTLLTIGIMSFVFLVLDYFLPMIIGVVLLFTHIISFVIFAKYYSKKV